MNVVLKIRTLLSIVFIMLSFLSCNKRDFLNSDLPITATPLFNAYINYLVINQDYTRIYAEQNKYSEVKAIARRGDIFVLLNTAGEDEKSFAWYQVQNNTVIGWVLTYNPYLVFSLDRAKLLSNQMLQK